MRFCCVAMLSLIPLIGQEMPHMHGAPSGLGHVEFPITCASDAQARFNRAMALLHSFEYEEAERSFRDVARSDPKCAMAFWGIAMSHYHPLWTPPSGAELAEGRSAIASALSAGPRTPRERAYIDALAIFYAEPGQRLYRERALAYEKAMESLHRQFPDDAEAAILYALALNATIDPTDKTYANQRKAGALLEPLFDQNPEHPGVAHYLIHSYDYPGLAAGALEAARSYAQIAPDSPHALHMPSHIFTRLGLWEECVHSNIAATDSGRNYSRAHYPGAAWSEQLHAMDYLVYAYLQMDRDRDAAGVLAELATIRKTEPADFKAAHTFAASPARYVLERSRWSEAARLKLEPDGFPWEKFPWAMAIHYFARTIGAARSGSTTEASQALAHLRAAVAASGTGELEWKNATEAMQLAAVAWVEHAEGGDEKALTTARQAADLEDSSEKRPVTPGAVLPARELLGDLLMEVGRPDEALMQYERSLQVAPKRLYALVGAARAARRTKNFDKARTYYIAVLDQCADRSGKTPREALLFLTGGH
ncbi:MAG: tetratricopeptide repeat protein [Bryobacteraceae bacterium]